MTKVYARWLGATGWLGLSGQLSHYFSPPLEMRGRNRITTLRHWLPILPDSFGFLGETGPSPSYPLWTASTLLPRLHLLLSSYLYRIKRKENFLCSACGHPLQDMTYLLFESLTVPHSSLFGTPSWHYFHFWPLAQTLGRDPTVGFPWSSSIPHPSEGVGKHHHHQSIFDC